MIADEEREKNLRERRQLRRDLAYALIDYRDARRMSVRVNAARMNLATDWQDRLRHAAIDIAEAIDRLGGRTHG